MAKPYTNCLIKIPTDVQTRVKIDCLMKGMNLHQWYKQAAQRLLDDQRQQYPHALATAGATERS